MKWVLTLIFLGALALRAPHLGLRPMHGDEAVHAVKFHTLWTTGQYIYDPREYHGPTIYDVLWPIVQLSGAQNFAEISAEQLRLVPLLFGIALIPMLWLVRDGFGRERGGMIWAALFIALSPLMVFYSRYFIQEMALIAFSFAAFVGAWRAYRSDDDKKRRAWLWFGGANVGLAFASKETAILALVCGVLSWALTQRVFRHRDGWQQLGRAFSGRERLWFFGVAFVVAALVLSNFGRNPRGTLDGVLTFATYISRAGAERGGEVQGALHTHPWYQYFEWLLWFRPAPGPRWTEVLPFVLALLALFSRPRRAHEIEISPADASQVLAAEVWQTLLKFYALSLMLLYVMIPYKTPWCALGFWHPFLILAGIGAARIVQWPATRQVLAQRRAPRLALQVLAGIALLVASVQLGMQSWASNVRFYVDRRNPWVYAHPVPDVDKLGQRVAELAPFSIQKQQMPVVTIARGGDYWPLPWNLRGLPNAGFFDETPANLAQFQAPVLVVAQAQLDEVAAQLGPNFEQKYNTEYFGLRPQLNMVLLVKNDLWQQFLKSR